MSLIKEFYILLDKKKPELMGYYQWFRFKVTRNRDSFLHETHFLRKNKCDKKYCVLRFDFPGRSLFSTALSYIFMYEWAVDRGYIPVVDMEYVHSYMQGRIGEDNKWEYCFQQPVSVKEMKNQNWVLIKGGFGISNSWMRKTCMDINGIKDDVHIHVTEKNWRDYYANINKYVKKCWIFKDSLLEEFENKYGNKLKNADGVVGVFLRENFSNDFYESLSDIEKKIYDKHPRVPNIERIIIIVKEYMDKWKCKYILVSSLYQDSVDKFRAVFGDAVFTIDRERKTLEESINTRPINFDMTDGEIYHKSKHIDYREMLISYVQEVIGLSRCDYLIAAKGGGAAAALSLNGGRYKDICILADTNESKWY